MDWSKILNLVLSVVVMIFSSTGAINTEESSTLIATGGGFIAAAILFVKEIVKIYNAHKKKTPAE